MSIYYRNWIFCEIFYIPWAKHILDWKLRTYILSQVHAKISKSPKVLNRDCKKWKQNNFLGPNIDSSRSKDLLSGREEIKIYQHAKFGWKPQRSWSKSLLRSPRNYEWQKTVGGEKEKCSGNKWDINITWYINTNNKFQ